MDLHRHLHGQGALRGIQPNGRKFSTSVMNFYVFDDEGKIIDDIAATGMLGILQGIGASGKKNEHQLSAVIPRIAEVARAGRG